MSHLREYKTIRALRQGEIVDLGGIRFRMAVSADGEEQEIEPGDLYIAERNTGPHLLEARENNREDRYIVPTTTAYCFDTSECVKVVEAEETANG